jgi:hypothetical protein
MKTKKQYLAPALTVVTFKVEQGYAASKTFSNIFDGNPLGDYNTFGQQKWMGVGEGGLITGNLFESW